MDDLPINERIEKRLAYADYLLNKTYPLVKEVKLFLEIINHLEAASRDLSEVQENEIFSAQGIKDSSVPKLSEKSSEFQEVFTSLKELKYAKDNDLFSFKRGESCGVVFYHEGKDLSLAVHGDDFTFCGV